MDNPFSVTFPPPASRKRNQDQMAERGRLTAHIFNDIINDTASSTSSSASPSSTSSPDTAAASRLNRRLPPLPPDGPILNPPRRYPGDGLDFRRPMSTTGTSQGQGTPSEAMGNITSSERPQSTIIDLTEDNDNDAVMQERSSFRRPTGSRASRMPRYSREIIDLSGDSSPPLTRNDQRAHEQEQRQQAQTPHSPEVQFVSERPRQPYNVGLRAYLPQPVQRHNSDEVQYLGGTTVFGDNVGVRNGTNQGDPISGGVGARASEALRNLLGGGNFRMGMNILGRDNNGTNRPRAGRVQEHPATIAFPRRHAHHHHHHHHHHAHPTRQEFPAFEQAVNFHVPDLIYTTAGFDLGRRGEDDEVQVRPTYEAPPSPGDGFTRSPNESDILVCPNCGDELCVGGDQDDGNGEMMRKEGLGTGGVWVARGCGHVYCGSCTTNRFKSKRKGKEASKSKPFSRCVVKDCPNVKPLSGKTAMIQLFL